MASNINSGIINDFTIRPKNLAQYTAFRGVVDYTQIGQFNPYETGYSFLKVISMPKYIEQLAKLDSGVQTMVNAVKHTLEYEFKGLSGLPDISSDTATISDGVNEMQMVNKVTMDTSIQVTSTFYEKSGSLLTKFSEYYLTGIKDRMSQAKTYHGLIKNGYMNPGWENEVFTFMYFVTDNSYLRLERAVLLTNAQLTKADISMYDSTKGDIGVHETSYEFNCFPVMGYEVDAAANTLLHDITGVNVSATDTAGNVSYSVDSSVTDPAALDSNDYLYGVLNPNDTTGSSINTLVTAANTAKGSV